jgi:hypothetical protein
MTAGQRICRRCWPIPAARRFIDGRRLIAFIANRTRPIARLHELSARLTRDATVSLQDLTDYVYLMDHLVGTRSPFNCATTFAARLRETTISSPGAGHAGYVSRHRLAVRRWRSRPSSTMLDRRHGGTSLATTKQPPNC